MDFRAGISSGTTRKQIPWSVKQSHGLQEMMDDSLPGKKMKITVSNEIRIDEATARFRERLIRQFTFSNPVWNEKKRLGRWLGKTPQQLTFYGTFGQSLFVPRGFIRQLLLLCRRDGIRYEIVDNRRLLPEKEFSFSGQLRPFQEEAVRALSSREFGTLSAPTGSGKTVMALWMVALRKQPALIVVHTRELLDQWIERTGTFLGIHADEVGQIGGGKKVLGGQVTVALVQSLYKCAHEVSEHIGHLIVDECHRTPARTFTEAVTAFHCRYMLGLSATPWRRDRLSRLIFWHLGELAHKINKADLEETGDVLPAEVVVRETDFLPRSDPVAEYPQMLSELTEDHKRNVLIARDVMREVQKGHGGVCLILSHRKAHCEAIRELLSKQGVSSELLTGDLDSQVRQQVVEAVNSGKVKVLVATGQLIGEGFDCKHLSILFLTTPIKFDGRLLQYLGRVLRPAPGKEKALIYDYVDVNVGVLVNAARARQRAYRRR